jgi:hypothetical protein
MEKLIDVGEPESRHLMSSYEVVLTERERCARIADSVTHNLSVDDNGRKIAKAIAAEIRSGK